MRVLKNQRIVTAVLALAGVVGTLCSHADPSDTTRKNDNHSTQNRSSDNRNTADRSTEKGAAENRNIESKNIEQRSIDNRNTENKAVTNPSSSSASHSRPYAWEEHTPGAVPDALGGFGMDNIFGTDKQRALSVVQLVRGDIRRKEVALTFDDGPHPPFTERLLDLLKQLNLRVTFFVVGRKVEEAPGLLVRMIDEGHEVANHTYHHPNLKLLPIGLVENEIRLDNDAIRRACGKQPLYFRPPGGQRNNNVIDIAHRLGMTTILWTDDPADYAKPGANVIEQKLLHHIRPGATILLHDGVEQTYQMLPDLVARLRQQGYRFVTVSEMVQHLEASRLGHQQ